MKLNTWCNCDNLAWLPSIIIGLISPLAVTANSLDSDQPRDSFLRRSMLSAEETRDDWSESWVDFAEGVDRYFSKEDTPPDYKNESYVKIQFKQTWEERGEIQTDMRVKAKFDLPNTQRKMKLFFSSDEASENSLEERVRSNSTGERFSRKESVSGIEISPDSEWHKWKRSARLGVKLRAPLVGFGRYRLRRPFENWGAWTPEFLQEVWYFSDRGWGESSEFELTRPLGDRMGLRYWTVLEFEDQYDYFQNVHVMSLSQGLSERTAIDYRAGLVFSTEFQAELTAYFVGTSYTYKLYEEWVFVTASPEVFFPRDQGWNAEASFTIKLDVYFSR
ncbi:hypothetical protein AB4876_07690 [Zhongshania guokunii]|uniref:Uncharacterized protein n=1 Tax=Zhongshania guokunii TaxID=641783 RepID=A0ABV3U5K0_9GAMM